MSPILNVMPWFLVLPCFAMEEAYKQFPSIQSKIFMSLFFVLELKWSNCEV